MGYYAVNNNELYHHGVKGMKWGVRRYVNYDGSYTKRGLERYRKAEARHDKNKSVYDKAKADYKSGKIDKTTLKRAKADTKMAKQKMSRAYDSLKKDNLADQGKNLYRSGKTITGNDFITGRISAGAGALGSLAVFLHGNSSYLNQKYDIDMKKIETGRNAAIAGSLALGAAATVKYAKDRYDAKRLRAYYAGGGDYRED